MASLLRILLEFLRRLRLAKDHINRFPRRWTSLLAYLVRKMGEWRFLWPRKPGTVRSPKPAEPSFPSDRAGSSSVSSSSVYTGGIGGYVVAASTVPASANYWEPPGRERAEPQSHTAPPTPTAATLSVDPPRSLYPSTTWTNQTVGSSHANPSSESLSNQSRASGGPSVISISRTSSLAPVQSDQLPQDPRATHRQFGPGPGGSRSRGRSSRSPSPDPSLNSIRLDNFDTAPTGAHAYVRADRVINPTIGPQGLTDLSPHTQERSGRPAIRREKTTSVGWNVQNPSTESLPIPLINAQEITEEPIAMDTSTHFSLHISPLYRPEVASQNSPTASSAISVSALPEGRILRLSNSDEIPRYTKNVKM